MRSCPEFVRSQVWSRRVRLDPTSANVERTGLLRQTLFGSRAIDLCNPSDPICHAGPGNAWSGHTQGYVPVYTDQAASFVAARILAVQPPTTAGPSATLAPSTAAESPIAFH